MRKKIKPSESLMSNPLAESSTEELVKELKRRSTGLLVGIMRVDENGDFWLFESKGSQIMVESLFFQMEEKFIPDNEDGELAKK